MLGCGGPVWHRDDLTKCFEQQYLLGYLPLLTSILSLIVLGGQTGFRIWHRRSQHDYQVSPQQEEGEESTIDDAGAQKSGTAAQKSLGRISRSGAAERIELSKPRGQLLFVIIEELACLGLLGIHLTTVATGCWGSRAAASAGLIWSIYLSSLVAIRLVATLHGSNPQSVVWYHTAALYVCSFFFDFSLLRSAVIHPWSALPNALLWTHCALDLLLFLIAINTRLGNRTIKITHIEGLKPSPEPLSGLFAIFAFTWVDPIIALGYKRTLELTDVWNLDAVNRASTILAAYRQTKRTTRLSWHLLSHFKFVLVIQAAWAVSSGLLAFVPTLLLQALLQYIENPVAPRNIAWLYVILLFTISVTKSFVDSQALFLGRKICIRLKAIVIGEIYAKALRRRVASPGESKVLGKQAQSSAPKAGWLNTIVGRRKTELKPDASAAAKVPDEDKQKDDAQINTGTIINLMAVDSFKISEVCAYLHYLWGSVPTQIVVAVVLLYRLLGLSAWAGIAIMILLLPINVVIARMFAKYQRRIMAATDGRIHITNEVLQNVRIIKFFAWEERFGFKISDKRDVELQRLRSKYLLWATAAAIWYGVPLLITFFSFYIYTEIEEKPLIPSVAFTALSLFSLLRVPLDQLADMLAHVQDAKVSVDRVEEFLNEEETQKYTSLSRNSHDEQGEIQMGFDNATLGWSNESESSTVESQSFKLIDMDVRFKVGKLNIIAGPTGSGKTSLLMGLLGEMNLIRGSIYLPGGYDRETLEPDPKTGLIESIAYCSQQPWLVNSTIKENIVFASEKNEKRYKAVVAACALQRDFEILKSGDETLVGEKGIALSGGQKQRISLARALYSKARHVLLDDCLSAVDSHTAQWIFDKCVTGPLMTDRTCVLVTHNVSLSLPNAEFVVVLDNGRIAAQGNPDHIMHLGILADDMSKSQNLSRTASGFLLARQPSGADLEELERVGSQTSTHAGEGANGDAHKSDRPQENPHREKKAEGRVKWALMVMYLKSMGPWWFWMAMAVMIIAQQSAAVGATVLITAWASSYAPSISTTAAASAIPVTVHPSSLLAEPLGVGTPLRKAFDFSAGAQQTGLLQSSPAYDDVDAAYYLLIYAFIGIVYMALSFLRELVAFTGALRASRLIHERLYRAVSHAKMRFFDSTPLGQIMNRFSKDLEAVDQEVSPVALGFLHCLVSIVAIVVLISVITPAFLIAGIIISGLYFLIGMYYICAYRDLKRLESTQRSPIFQQFGETLAGVSTIRAYGDQTRFMRENLSKIDTQNRPFYYLWATNRWLSIRVDLVGALVTLFAGSFIVLAIGKIDAGSAGLSLTYALTFNESVLWVVRLWALNEINFNSVERIKEYIDVEQEAKARIPENAPASDWPAKGAVEFIDYSTRYREDLDLVLKNVSFKVEPLEKVGIVGRTGAGKSSLALALFRGLEAESGKIIVDGVDISTIGLSDLRESITIVPQDPTLFSGSIRENLDPFGLYTDEEIYTSLRRVRLIDQHHFTASNATTQTHTPDHHSPKLTPSMELLAASSAIEADLVTEPTPTNTAEAFSSHPEIPSIPFSDAVGDLEELAPAAAIDGETAIGESDKTKSAQKSVSGKSSSTAVEPEQVNKNIFRDLQSQVTESGSNLSQGQRQLLCLARALLSQPKIVLLDEATASVDYKTDHKLQETIREMRASILTIAHRLQTIVDYDKVIVMDKGEVREVGHPFELIMREGGVFRDMCVATGDVETLEELARKAWDGRRGGF